MRAEQLETGQVEMGPSWLGMVSDDRLRDIAAQFIGPAIALFASHYIAKPPFKGQAAMWYGVASMITLPLRKIEK